MTPDVAPGSLERPDARRPATIWVVALGLEIGGRGPGRDHRVDVLRSAAAGTPDEPGQRRRAVPREQRAPERRSGVARHGHLELRLSRSGAQREVGLARGGGPAERAAHPVAIVDPQRRHRDPSGRDLHGRGERLLPQCLLRERDREAAVRLDGQVREIRTTDGSASIGGEQHHAQDRIGTERVHDDQVSFLSSLRRVVGRVPLGGGSGRTGLGAHAAGAGEPACRDPSSEVLHEGRGGAVGAATCWATSPPAGTVTETGSPGPSAVSVVSLAVTSWVPGFARKTVACHPSPPPCGQNQAPEGAWPGATGPGVAGPTRANPQPDQHGEPHHRHREHALPARPHRATGFLVIQSAASHIRASNSVSMVRGSCEP